MEHPDESYEYPTLLTLVCGSRSLVQRPGGEAWARHIIECITDHANLVVTGDAPGPDTWVRERMARTSIRCVVFSLDGTVREGADGREIGRWCPAERVSSGSRWPLVRDAAMVRAVARRARMGRLAAVYALKDPLSPTDGTGQTVREARRAGLQTWVETWSAAQAAEGMRAG